jgi:hypothetical protein
LTVSGLSEVLQAGRRSLAASFGGKRRRMTTASTKRCYRKAEFARRGNALVESKVCPNRTAADEDKFVAIDIETDEFELDGLTEE